MSLKVIALKKQRDSKKAELKQLRAKLKQLRADEAELNKQIDGADDVTDELVAQVDELEAQTTETTEAIDTLEGEIADIEEKLDAIDTEPPADDGQRIAQRSVSAPAAKPAAQRAVTPAVSGSGHYRSRSNCFSTRGECEAFYARSDVHEWLDRIRSLGGSGRRSVMGAEIEIPEIVLDLMRDHIDDYSKLAGLVKSRQVKGTSRQPVLGKSPEGVWTEMCADLNELEFAFTEAEMDGYKVGGYIPIDNAILKDSDLNMGEEIISMLMRAIGKARDKAVVYGLGSTGKMPVGIVTRLAQTKKPDYWGTKQGDWEDLHSSNILKLDLGSAEGTAFFRPLLAALSKACPDYSDNGQTVWIMNRKTHMDLLSRGLNFNAAGALVAGLSDAMPVENGKIIELEFMPDYEFVGGFMDCYLSVEREGGTVAQSEHVFFLQDKTVYKATARYDGQPIIAEAFVLVNYNNVEPTTAASFETDYANTALNALIATSAASGDAGKVTVTVSGVKSTSNQLYYKAQATSTGVKAGDTVGTGYAKLSSGTTKITAVTGTPISVIEADADGRVVSAGSVIAA